MEIIEASPSTKIVIKLDFLKPFEAHNTAEFTMEPKGDTTLSPGRCTVRAPIISKVMGMFMDMDKMIGNDFEAGCKPQGRRREE